MTEERTPTIRRPGLAAAAVLVSSFMSFFDFTAVYVALPAIQLDLATDYATVQWVAIGYALPFALLLITGGRAGDVFGHRRAFLVGLAGFTIASGVSGAVDSVLALALARVAQGVAGALMAPQVLALFRVLVPARRRAVATIAYAATVGLATMAGPALGGWLAGADLLGLGWRSIFLINVPLGAFALVAGLACVPVDRGRTEGERLRPDAGGIALATVTLLLLLCPLLYGPAQGWPWWSGAGLAAALPALALFVGHQRRRHRAGRDTLLALPLFRIREFDAGLAVNFAVASLLTGFIFVLAVHLQDGLGLSPAGAGATMVIAPVATTLASVAAPRLMPRFGRRLLLAGAVLTVAGFALVQAVVPLGGAGLVVMLVLFGLGTGLVSTPVLTMTMSVVPVGDAGAAAGLFSTFRQIGAALGVALNGAVYFAVLAASGSHADAIRGSALLDAGSALVMLALLFLLPRSAAAPAPGARVPAS